MKKMITFILGMALSGAIMADTFYLQSNINGGTTIDKSLWFDAPSGGTDMATLGADFFGNNFNLQTNQVWNTDMVSFDGTLVIEDVPAANATPIVLGSTNWLVNGLNISTYAKISHATQTVFQVASMDVSSNVVFRNIGAPDNYMELSVTTLTGSGVITFGQQSSDDAFGFGLSVSDGTGFSGTIYSSYGPLSFNSALTLSNATLNVDTAQASAAVVLDNSATFNQMVHGGSSVPAGTYTAAQLNVETGSSRYSGSGSITILTDTIPEPLTFYLHANMLAGSTPNDKTLWFDDPVGGTSQYDLDAPNTGNNFDMNGYEFRTASGSSHTFAGTLLVGASTLAMMYADEWNLAGMNVSDGTLLLRPHRTTVDMNVEELTVGASGIMDVRTLTGNNVVNLSVADLSGSGHIRFGIDSYSNDTNGVWSLSVTDPDSEFNGTVDLTRGELTFNSSFALSNATFAVNLVEDNSIVLNADVSFGKVILSSGLEAGTYTVSQLNSELGADRFSGTGTITVLTGPTVFYLHAAVPANQSILDKELWFDDPSGGSIMTENDSFSGNRFDVNGFDWRALGTSGTSEFEGTVVVGAAGSGLCLQYTADWLLTGGMDIDEYALIRPHRTAVSMTVANLALGSSGELVFRTLTGNNVQDLSVANISGSGTIEFGISSYENDINGVWGLSITDTTSEFTGAISLVRGQLTFASEFTLRDASFVIASTENNSVVLANDVTFNNVEFGAVTLTDGTYTASELNSALGTSRFSGAGTVTLVDTQAATFENWAVDNGLSGDNALTSADPDSDGMDNLLEYALGGIPNTDDAASVLPEFTMVDVDGTNWIEYVYNRRLDAGARGLAYDVILSADLTAGSWSNIGQTAEFGSAPIDEDFESVTNRIATDVSVRFTTLKVTETQD